MTTLAVVTATASPSRAFDCFRSWEMYAVKPYSQYVVVNGAGRVYEGAVGWSEGLTTGLAVRQTYHADTFLGVVPAYAIGVARALADGAEIIACLHDDLLIEEAGWDETVRRLFKACPRAGLCGFGGGRGLGDPDLYQKPYNPMQLARREFISNMRDAEAHGRRSTDAMPVACLDGFSQVGLRSYWMGLRAQTDVRLEPAPDFYAGLNLFHRMASLGVTHHMYDGMLGCYARRLGYQTWFVPVRCHHFGGRTAVGDGAYHQWAVQQDPEGDAGFWKAAHRICYEEFRDVLPIAPVEREL